MGKFAVWFCLTIQILLLRAAVDAEEMASKPTPAAPSAKSGADYGPAFDKLIQLGLADARGASYVKLTLQNDNDNSRNWSNSSNPLKTKGNAWLLPNSTDSAGILIARDYEKLEVSKKKKKSGLLRLLTGSENTSSSDQPQGDWSKQDAIADAQVIIDSFKTDENENSLLNDAIWAHDPRQTDGKSELLVRACHLYRAGFEKEGNEIAHHVLSLASEPILVIDNIVNTLATQEYQTLVNTFFESKDWKAYHDGTAELISRFSRGWRSREGVELLLKQLAMHLDGTTKSPQTFEDVTLNSDALHLIKDWKTMKDPIVVNPQLCWLLHVSPDTPNEEQAYHGEENAPVSLMTSFRPLGMNGFITLVAMADDDTLLQTSLEQYSGHGQRYSSRSHFSGMGQQGSDPARTQYDALTRPCSNGDVARAIIIPTLPDPDDDLATRSPEEIRIIAHQWWLAHRTDSASSLAKHFLTEGSDSQRAIAAMSLIQIGDPESFESVEQFLLSEEDLISQSELLVAYLKTRKQEAAPFFKSYSETLKNQIDSSTSGSFGNWQIREAGGVDKYLKTLEVLIKDISPEQIIADMRSGKTDADGGLGMLTSVMKEGQLRQHLPSLISIARIQEGPDEQYAFLAGVHSLVYADQEFHTAGGREKEYQASLPELLEKSKEDWHYFLNQDHPLQDAASYGDPPSMAAAASWLLGFIYSPQFNNTRRELSGILERSKIWDHSLAQGKKFLAEGADANFPSPENVSKARKASMRAQINSMPASKIVEYFNNLSLDEKLVWNEILRSFEEKIPEGLATLRKTVTKMSWSNEDESDGTLRQELEKLLSGQLLTADTLNKAVDLIFDKVGDDSHLVASLQRSNSGAGGIQVSVDHKIDAQYEGWKMRVLGDSLESLLDGSVKKMIGVYSQDAENGEAKIGIRLNPASEEDLGMDECLAQLAKSANSENRFYVMIIVETAAKMKLLKTEQENEAEE